MAGALVALGSLAAGGALLAQDQRRDRQQLGTYIMLGGFAAAPWVSHGIAGRWRRALVFGLASVAASAAVWGAMRVQDPFDGYIANRDRLAFGVLFTTAFFTGGLGVVDSIVVGPEPRSATAR